MTALPGCTEYITSIETPQLIKAAELAGGKVVTKNGKPLRYAGGFCVVFPYEIPSGKKVAVRCWTAYVPDAEKRSRRISQCLQQSGLPYFVGFDYIEKGVATSLGVFPIVVMDWVNATPLKNYLQANLHNPTAIKTLADSFLTMTNDLHSIGYSHGDLQHGNIMVASNGQIFLVDYDSMFVPGLENVTDEIKGLAGYQHPSRSKLKYLNPKTDYFSELIIYTSLLALYKYPSLWTELNIEDTETLVFTQEDLDYPTQSKTIQNLKSDSDLSDCVKAIESALRKTNIEDLLPLNEAIIPEATKIVGGLQEKWKQHTPPPITEPSIDKEGLRGKWKKVKPEVIEESVDVSPISSKWK